MSVSEPRYFAAVDLGSSNGKICLGILRNGDLQMQEIYRFDHAPVTKNGTMYWDWENICAEVICGLRQAALAAPAGAVEAVSCDSWAQDFGLLDGDGNILETPRCYRNTAFEKAVALTAAYRPAPDDQLNINGTAVSSITTLNQLVYRRNFEPETLEKCRKILHVADLIHHLLGGTMTGDPTLLGISQLFDIRTGNTDTAQLTSIGIDPDIVPVPAAGIIGEITHPELRELYPHAKLVAGAGHDTAAAFAGAEVQNDEYFISLGSWRMCGFAADLTRQYSAPGALLTLRQGKLAFFTGGSGMYLVQRCCAKWKTEAEPFSFAALDDEAEKSLCDGLFDVEDPVFSAPDTDYPAMIRQKIFSGTIPVTRGDTLRAINISLSHCIRQDIQRMTALRGREFAGAVMVSGGIRNRELVANFTARTGLKLRCGVAEASARGNLLNAISAFEN